MVSLGCMKMIFRLRAETGNCLKRQGGSLRVEEHYLRKLEWEL